MELPHEEVFRRFTDPPPLSEDELASSRRGIEQLGRGEWVAEDDGELADGVDFDR
jgi:hypothetical protein